jgi:hypothetical protein
VYSVFFGLSVILTGCVYDPFYYGPPPHSHYSPYYYDYYFYPSVQVYFQFTTGYYFYRDRGVWARARVLPPRIIINARDRIRIKVESEKPYLKFPEHSRIYKPNPKYRVDKEKSLKEREANKKWFREYQQRKDKAKKMPKEKRDKDKRGRF